MGAKSNDSEQLFNRNLTALVAVIFLFYGGLSCLYSTFIPHLIELGFETFEISHMLTIVALVSILGPLIFAPLIDLIADRYKGHFGRYLQYILALLLILGAVAYSRLLVVPPFRRTPTEEIPITFGCDSTSAVIFQQRCNGTATHCHYWDDEKLGELELVNCSYTCQNPKKYEQMYHPWVKTPPIESIAQPLTDLPSSKEDSEDYDIDDPPVDKTQVRRQRRDIQLPKVQPPHICTQNKNNHSIVDKCQVYTKDIRQLKVNAKLQSAMKQENDSASYCKYPIGECSILSIKSHPKLA